MDRDYTIIGPDGSEFTITGPEGATPEQLRAAAERAFAMRPPVKSNNSIGAQTGLFARSAVRAAAALPAMGADAIGGLANAGLDVIGDTRTPRFQQTMPTIDRLLSRIGLPEPQTANERIVGTGVEMGLGAGGAAKASNWAANKAGPLFKEGLSRLGANREVQMMAGAGAGLAGQQSKENGDSWLTQLASSVVGALLGGGGAAGVKGLIGGAKDLLTGPKFTPQVIDQRINIALQNSGIDPASVNPAMRRALQEEVEKALKTGGNVADDALVRLADYKRVGATPTAGRLSLDPYQITQEMNAAKQAAALGVRDAKLPQIAADNNKQLISLLDDFAPLADRSLVGARAVAPIAAKDAAMQAFERQLYGAAENQAGGQIPLARGGLNAIYDKLNAARKIRFVPEAVMGTIDDILNDTRSPFDVNTLDALKTTIATAQRGTQDGNVKAALKIVRDTIDSIDLTPVKRDFGGNQLVTQQTAQKLTAADRAAADLMAQLNKARQAAFERRSWQRTSPLIENTLDDADPSRFVETIVSRSTAPKDVATAARVINSAPDARDAVRSGIAQYLKDAAIGKGNQSATGNFSGRQLASALDNIGDSKLKLFFDAEEIEQLKAMARVGTTETFQPRGSAVNNSNTGAAVASLLQGLSKYIKPVASKLPFGEAAISTPLNNLTVASMERSALNTPRGLLNGPLPKNGLLLDQFAFPLLMGSGGLLSFGQQGND